MQYSIKRETQEEEEESDREKCSTQTNGYMGNSANLETWRICRGEWDRGGGGAIVCVMR